MDFFRPGAFLLPLRSAHLAVQLQTPNNTVASSYTSENDSQELHDELSDSSSDLATLLPTLSPISGRILFRLPQIHPQLDAAKTITFHGPRPWPGGIAMSTLLSHNGKIRLMKGGQMVKTLKDRSFIRLHISWPGHDHYKKWIEVRLYDRERETVTLFELGRLVARQFELYMKKRTFFQGSEHPSLLGIEFGDLYLAALHSVDGFEWEAEVRFYVML